MDGVDTVQRAKSPILVFGTICIDRVYRVPFVPPPGGYVDIEQEVDLLGGEAANTAVALLAWGAQIRLSGGRVAGPVLLGLLAAKGLPTEGLAPSACKPDHAEPVCQIYVTPTGDRTMFGQGFSETQATLGSSRIPYQAGAWFTADPNLGEIARTVGGTAIEAGMKLYLMDFIKEADPIEKGSFWQSSTDWVGHRNDLPNNLSWVRSFVAKRRCFTILTDGPNGFIAGSPDHTTRAFPAFPAPAVVDTTGAGDMFRAGMLFGLWHEWPIADCLRFASAAGCLSCKGFGATGFIPTVEEVLAHIDLHPEVGRQYS